MPANCPASGLRAHSWRWSPVLLLLLWSLAACSDDNTRYAEAVTRLTALEAQVDAHFAQARAQQTALFGDHAWDDPAAMEQALLAAADSLRQGEAKQRQRITLEEEILAFPFLAASAETRLLYRLDLDSQRAKLQVFVIAREMYETLLPELRQQNRDDYRQLARVYSQGISTANQRYRELDLLRQQQQTALNASQATPI